MAAIAQRDREAEQAEQQAEDVLRSIEHHGQRKIEEVSVRAARADEEVGRLVRTTAAWAYIPIQHVGR